MSTQVNHELLDALETLDQAQRSNLERRLGGNLPEFQVLAASLRRTSQARSSTDSMHTAMSTDQVPDVQQQVPNIQQQVPPTNTAQQLYTVLSAGSNVYNEQNQQLVYTQGSTVYQQQQMSAPQSGTTTHSATPTPSPHYHAVAVSDTYTANQSSTVTSQSTCPTWHSIVNMTVQPVPHPAIFLQGFNYATPIQLAGQAARYPTVAVGESRPQQFSLRSDPYRLSKQTFNPITNLANKLDDRIRQWYAQVPVSIGQSLMVDTSGFVSSAITAEPPRAVTDRFGFLPCDTDELVVNQAEVVRQDACVRTMLKMSELDELMLVGLQRLTLTNLPSTREQIAVWANDVGRLVNVLRHSHSQREDLLLDVATITTAQRRRDNSHRTYGTARLCDVICPISDTKQHVIPAPTTVSVAVLGTQQQAGSISLQQNQYQQQ